MWKAPIENEKSRMKKQKKMVESSHENIIYLDGNVITFYDCIGRKESQRRKH